jgi:hemerythrin
MRVIPNMKMTDKEMFVFLARIPGFKDLPKTYLQEKIIPNIGVSQFAKGETIVEHGKMQKTIFIVKRGLGLCKSQNPELSDDQIYLEKGSVLGDLDLVTGQPLSITVSAVSPTTCLTLDIYKFNKTMLEEFKFNRAFHIQAITQNIYITTKIEVGKYHKSGEFNFDIKKVYEQYKTLLAAIKKLRVFLNSDDSVSDKDWGKQNLISELLNYTENYIQDKESSMDGGSTEKLAEFKNFHQNFASDVVAFNNRVKGLSGKKDKLELLDDVQKFMGNWLLQNLMRDDDSFAEYINEKDVAKSREPVKPIATKPQEAEPEVAKPEAIEAEKIAAHATEPSKPKSEELETTEPESVEIVTAEPESVEPVTSEPKIIEPEIKEPEIKEPEIQETKSAEFKTSEPESVEAVISEPENIEPKIKEAESVELETPEPETPESTEQDKIAESESLEIDSNNMKALEALGGELVGEIQTSPKPDSWEWEQKILAEQALDEKENGEIKPPAPPEPQSRNNMAVVGVAVSLMLVAGYIWWQPSDVAKDVVYKEPLPAKVINKEESKQLDSTKDSVKKQSVAVVKLPAKEKLTQLASNASTATEPQPVIQKQKVNKVTLPIVQTKKPIVEKVVAVKQKLQPSSQLPSISMNIDSEGIPRGPDAENKKGFFISMGCFSKKQFAVGQIKRVMKLSIPVYLKSIRDDTLHCVFGGPLPTRDAADAAAQRSRNEARVENTTVKSY